MNLNIKIFLLCPIPEDQKPINEYIELKENDFSKLILSPPKNYFLKLVFDFGLFFLLSIPIAFLFKVTNNFVLFNCFFSINSILIIFLINFLRWRQLLNKFRNSRLFYEEGSWYDGQVWEKPLEVIKNDKLLSIQKIKPVLKRIRKTLIILISLNFYFYFINPF